MGRVKLKFPWLSGNDESAWARMAVPMAGKDRGVYFLPEVDDEVLVVFGHGDFHNPYVIGALWNGVDAPPADNGDGHNDIRVIKSRSGHVIRLTDTDGAEKIEIIDKSGDNAIVIDTSANCVTLRSGQDITLSASNGTIKLEAGSIEIKSTSGNLKLESGAGADIKASGALNLKGATVNLN
jgi:uncharacterized protein involved in type VI secretion and phage assembly